MFDSTFAHYLSYGATDQQTVRALAGSYTGLLVPGTVAAFQRDGTGGFVLTLSATPDPPEYAIDPRTPLFQQGLSKPKKSHQSLADLLGIAALIRADDPDPSEFTDDVVGTMARNWAQFNGDYRSAAGSKFAKYATRLGQLVQPRDAQQPTFVFPPYFVARRRRDPWWDVSQRLFQATVDELGDAERAVRVVATTSGMGLADLLADVDDVRAAIWVSGLEELTADSDDLAEYAEAVSEASNDGMDLFALYGGFFSVLLQNLGLSGSSHGIGFGEYRQWVELPSSGPPPARYYLPQLHRYVQPDEATQLYFADRRLAACECVECESEPPIALDYHALMRHSVRCRATEINEWSGLGVPAAIARLSREFSDFRGVLHTCGLPDIAVNRIEQRAAHIPRWIGALRVCDV